MEIERLCPRCMGEMPEGNKKICPHCGYDFDSPREITHQLKPFTILEGKYLVGDVLGEGGFGITYIGFDLNLEIKVAIKEFYPNGFATRESQYTSELTAYAGQNMDAVYKWRDNFVKEARSLAKCSHLPGIVGVKDYFQENNTAYIIMEYLEGQTLKEHMKARGGKLPAEDVFGMMRPVISSLEEVHKEGLIHRDISPDNLILLKGGNVKLLDFGAARDYTDSGEKSLSVMLKPGYAPEEQYRTKGKQGPWSDVYALCATMYKCITGITPPESMERMRQDELKKISSLGISISPQGEAALEKGMAVFAEERCQSMGELENLLYGSGMAASVSTVSQSAVPAEKPAIPAPLPGGVPAENAAAPDNLQKIKEQIRNNKNVILAAVGVIAVLLLIISVSSNQGMKKTKDASAETALTGEQDISQSQQPSSEMGTVPGEGEEAAPKENTGEQEEESEKTVEEAAALEAESLLTAYREGLDTVSLDGRECGFSQWEGYLGPTSDLEGIQGTLASLIRDMDGDGISELVTVDICDSEEEGGVNEMMCTLKDIVVSVYEAEDGGVVCSDSRIAYTGLYCNYWWFQVCVKDNMVAVNGYETWTQNYDEKSYTLAVLNYGEGELGSAAELEYYDYMGAPVDINQYRNEIEKLRTLGFGNTCAWIENYQDIKLADEEGMECFYYAETENKMWDYKWYYGSCDDFNGDYSRASFLTIGEMDTAGQMSSNGISVSTDSRADYGLALDFSQYQSYSGLSSFSYPTNLYSSVSVETHPFTFSLGTNQETVTFRGRDGANRISNMLFATYSWDSGTDVKSQHDFTRDYMTGTMTDAEVILDSCDETTVTESGVPYGKLVITGYASAEHDYMIYMLVRLEPGTTQVMRIVAPVTPGDNTSADYQQKCYFMENMYRMCNFSGSSKGPRTFDQFVRGEDL